MAAPRLRVFHMLGAGRASCWPRTRADPPGTALSLDPPRQPQWLMGTRRCGQIAFTHCNSFCFLWDTFQMEFSAPRKPLLSWQGRRVARLLPSSPRGPALWRLAHTAAQVPHPPCADSRPLPPCSCTQPSQTGPMWQAKLHFPYFFFISHTYNHKVLTETSPDCQDSFNTSG